MSYRKSDYMGKNDSQKQNYNEKTRVQIPAMVHLLRLGYTFYGKISRVKKSESGEMVATIYDEDTNILLKVFDEQFKKLNPECEVDYKEALKEIKKVLDNDDLGKSFYKMLTSVSPYKLIDFENVDNNVFHFTGEYTFRNGDDEFRPDITLFINGMPLVFMEVKKPNNKDGMLAEANRLNDERFSNKKFRRFLNITQFMIFSNNMEYDAMNGIVPVQGAFYATNSKTKAKFNCFREENRENAEIAPYISDYKYENVDENVEKKILISFNAVMLKNRGRAEPCPYGYCF